MQNRDLNEGDRQTHHAAPTHFVEAAGIRFAYRRFGKKVGIPLLFNIHFLGTMDHWDPMITDGIAQDPDAGHGSLYQYPELYVAYVNHFLNQ